jgi:hypothetical protein
MPLGPEDLSRSLQLLTKLLFAAVLVTGCGGGGSGSSSAPAKSSFTAGPITGFGSVIINGTRFDVSNATVANDDDEAHGESDLKLGMMAEVEGGAITVDSTGSHGQANHIHFRSAIIGPVDAIDIPTRLLIVLGQTIDVSNTTVFGASLANGPFSISVGDALEIFGMLDTNTGHYAATRIEKVDPPFYKLRGMVQNLDTRARTFMIGGEPISYRDLSSDQAPEGLADGQLVVAKLEKTQAGSTWIAVKIKIVASNIGQHDKVELKGRITSGTSMTQFSVDGVPVDASNAQVLPQGATLFVGAEVEVEGTVRDGVIIATSVTLKNENDDAHDGFELHGAIESLDTTAQTFVLHGVAVSYGGSAVVFEHGKQSDLAQGRKVEVKATLSTGGTSLVATTIRFED